MRRLRRHEGLGINRSTEAGGAIVEARLGQIGTHSGLLIRCPDPFLRPPLGLAHTDKKQP